MAVSILLVVDNPASWPLRVSGVEVVAAQRYLTEPTYSNLRNLRVFNLCRSYSYQSTGYYVSLLAEARGHRPQPDVVTIQDMKSVALVRAITDELDHVIQRSLHAIRSDVFELSIYFGKTLAKRDQQLGLRLFGLLRAPLMRAQFVRKRHKWLLQGVRPIPAQEIPETHHDTVVAAAQVYFTRRQWTGPTRSPRYRLAILVNPLEEQPPSDELALDRFARAAERQGVSSELITRDDFGRVGVFDGLFIRTTTFVNDYTYRFARRAAAEGLAVIDDPVSIARCTNKVYLAERLASQKVPIPPTLLVHEDNIEQVVETIGLPCVLKQPDSAFSAGVTKVETIEQCRAELAHLLEESDMVVAQPFVPTEFDWRVGVLDGKPLYVCKYYMARHHWQILRRSSTGRILTGRAQTLAVEDAPRAIVRTAIKAANLIGDGLYGVDLKQFGRKIYVIEVNDNPSIEGGVEDLVMKDQLYNRVIESFIRRIESIRSNGKAGSHR